MAENYVLGDTRLLVGCHAGVRSPSVPSATPASGKALAALLEQEEDDEDTLLPELDTQELSSRPCSSASFPSELPRLLPAPSPPSSPRPPPARSFQHAAFSRLSMSRDLVPVPTLRRGGTAPNVGWISFSTKSASCLWTDSLRPQRMSIGSWPGAFTEDRRSLQQSVQQQSDDWKLRTDTSRASTPRRSTAARIREHSLRAVAWTVAVASALVMTMAPLMFDERCYVDAWESNALYEKDISPKGYVLGELIRITGSGAPLVGEHFGVTFISLWVAASYCRRTGRNPVLARWVRYYLLGVGSMSLAAILIPWAFVACPEGYMAFVYGALRGMWYLSYFYSKLCLASISVVRLRLLHQDCVASQCERLAKVWAAFGFITLLTAPLFSLGIFSAWVPACLSGFCCLLYCSFMIRVVGGLVQATKMAFQEAKLSQRFAKETDFGIFVTCVLSLSTGTTLGALIHTTLLMSLSLTSSWQFWTAQCVLFLDVFSDALLALACGGMLGLTGSAEQALEDLVQAAHERQVLIALTDAARAVTGPSVTLAALFEGQEPEDLLRAAVKRFRCISWATLRQHPYLITGGGTLDGGGVATNLYELSEPCQLSSCDAFLSHSWHDNGELKWEALTEWCEAFWLDFGRPPRLWFDKVCINQTDIRSDLQCLPVFVAGCNTLLVTCGKTYTSRLWCCVELFVYMKMAEGLERDIQACVLSSSAEEEQEIVAGWGSFDLHSCRCYSPDDKKRILECIEKDAGGANDFNIFIRTLSKSMFQAVSKVRTLNTGDCT
eukprot:TRINITY_DN15217_c0_g3_i1.p1 TRINITY_DN15217_c0_g3~~TRINITY_DN15217_c0_g3_i1.p1  ORF type:complete len:778 (+),score=48.94 TRINITY_DN15217_c0_g3_i1:203-2536(+)